MIVITADFRFEDPAVLDQALDLATPLQQATRDDEPGCQAYVFSADPCVEGRMVVYELWDDQASLAAHFQHPNYLNMGRGLAELGLASAVSQKWRITAAEPVYDDTPVARADFFTVDEQAPDDPIVVAGYIDLHDPAERDDLLRESIPRQLATRNDEPGCQMYAFTPDPCVPARIAVVEVWDDQASLAAHFEHENYFSMAGVIRGAKGGRSSDNRKYRADLHEPVYDDTFTPRADFFSVS